MKATRWIVLLTAAFAAAPAGLAAQSAGPLVLRGRVVDGTGAAALEAGEVTVVAGRIDCVGAMGICAVPSGAQVIDAGSGTILPGLIDAHTHVFDTGMLAMFLPAGVTAIRDLHNALPTLARLEAVEMPRPRIVKAGPLIDGRRTWPGALLATTPEEGIAAVDSVTAAGVDVVKLYNGLDSATFAATAARTREKGFPITADLFGSRVDALAALEHGVRGFEHGGGFLTAYSRLGGDRTAMAIDTVLLDRIVAAILEHDAYLVPTLIVQRQYALDETPSLEGVPMADRVQPFLRVFWTRRDSVPPEFRERFRANMRFVSALANRLVQRGGRVGAGSDLPNPYVVPGGALHQELELLVEAGLTPLQAIRAATAEAAKILGFDDVGRIAAGQAADLIIVDGDPTRDIRATRAVRTVVLRGQVYTQQELLQRAPPVQPAPGRVDEPSR